MADINDPTVWIIVVQTVVLTLTLAIFIMTFREQNKATRENAYQKVLDDYTDSMKMIVENPVLGKLPLEMARIQNRPIEGQSTEDLVIRNYMLLVYGIFERTHLLFRKKWIDKDTWDQWALFLKSISAHPAFQNVHRLSEGMFDKPFTDYVTSILDKRDEHVPWH